MNVKTLLRSLPLWAALVASAAGPLAAHADPTPHVHDPVSGPGLALAVLVALGVLIASVRQHRT